MRKNTEIEKWLTGVVDFSRQFSFISLIAIGVVCGVREMKHRKKNAVEEVKLHNNKAPFRVSLVVGFHSARREGECIKVRRELTE